ncbi:YciI family protein [Actinacidiphila acidipaludis]|uniref:YciI family protein n=1 Tax=Actinacidiphila acidipaludis TaxID=2873382 RepID=A0ABS7Q899_9ACTN|nr:YciI family protein [Streptomyces acidipaludis]MBY8879386.1 YciI family protein [Streptomyces acidipaludis]
MKQYLLSVVTPTGGEPPAPEELKAIMADVEAFHDELKAAGAWVFAGGLHAPETATVVQVTGGETVMTDGPFIEGKEYLGGICIVKAPDLDAALEWGRKAATAISLPIEVRSFVQD